LPDFLGVLPLALATCRTQTFSSRTSMTTFSTCLPYDPNRLLDHLREWTGATSDHALSILLRLSPQLVRSMRIGRLPVRISILLSMAECVGKNIDELRSVLGDRRRKARMPSIVRAA
jgi:hypothetical protein